MSEAEDLRRGLLCCQSIELTNETMPEHEERLEAAYAAADSLTTRLAEVTRERDAIRTERQEAVAHALHVEERNNIAEVEAAELREQLTQAREAWDTWADHSLRRHKCDWGYTERPEAFATTNREGETEA